MYFAGPECPEILGESVNLFLLGVDIFNYCGVDIFNYCGVDISDSGEINRIVLAPGVSLRD